MGCTTSTSIISFQTSPKLELKHLSSSSQTSLGPAGKPLQPLSPSNKLTSTADAAIKFRFSNDVTQADLPNSILSSDEDKGRQDTIIVNKNGSKPASRTDAWFTYRRTNSNYGTVHMI